MQPTLLGVAGAGRLLRLRRTRRGQELGRRRGDSITSKKLRMTNAGSSEHDFPAGPSSTPDHRAAVIRFAGRRPRSAASEVLRHT